MNIHEYLSYLGLCSPINIHEDLFILAYVHEDLSYLGLCSHMMNIHEDLSHLGLCSHMMNIHEGLFIMVHVVQ